MSIEIIDNFLDDNIFNQIKNSVMGENFPWGWSDNITHEDSSADSLNHFQFTNTIIWDGKLLQGESPIKFLSPILDKLDLNEIFRLKFNLQTITQEHYHTGLHSDAHQSLDNYKNLKAAILYFNTNNGYTLFESGEKIESLENRIAIFNASKIHESVTQTDQKRRVVLNINYF